MGKQPPTILVVLGSGGHTTELMMLLRKLGPSYSYEYLMARTDGLSPHKLCFPGTIHRILNPFDYQTHDRSLLTIIPKMVLSAFQAIGVLFRSRASVMLSAGSVLTIAPIILGKLLFRKQVVYVESASRVTEPSWAGRLIYPFADLFFVQWPQLQKKFPRAVYAGRFL